MKKTTLLVTLFLGTACLFSACKKDNETEKEKTAQLLNSGKWYYQSVNTNTCFDASDYWEFKTDGSLTETWDFGNMTYTIADDGKSFSIEFDGRRYTATITSITKDQLKFQIVGEGALNFTLAKTAATPTRC